MSLQYFEEKLSFYQNIFLSQYCVQKYCVWCGPKAKTQSLFATCMHLFNRFDWQNKIYFLQSNVKITHTHCSAFLERKIPIQY